MNRMFLFGIALFFAVVGIAILGGQEKARAGHGCGGCEGVVAACDSGCGECVTTCSGRCFGRLRHHARAGCRGRLFGHRRCCGQPADCCGQPADCCGQPVADCCGAVTEAAPVEAAPVPAQEEAPPAPPAGEAK